MAHLFVSAAHKSSGKTTVSLGMCAALKARGLDVQPFKKGPDYIDPMWLTQASGRPCHNLDFYTMDRDEILGSAASNIAQADIGIIEGNKGLYDGLDLDGSNSNAALASLLSAPVILVLDARGMTRGIAPLILGYQSFDESVNIAGVILNQLGGSRHEAKLRAVIEHYTDVPVVGAIARNPELEIVERHLGLIPSNEANAAAEQISTIGDIVGTQIDLEALLGIAGKAHLPASTDSAIDSAPSQTPDVRIGLARDSAFGFYYPDDLLALERAGAELVPFNTITDSTLPDIDGLFIGGGFPESRMDELEKNASLRYAIRTAIEGGLPCYAECGGLMYLARNLTWKDQRREMVGVIGADVVIHDRPQGRGYVRLQEKAHSLWPEAGSGAEIAAHEFHYSALENLDSDQNFAYQVLRGTGIDGKHDGLIYKNLLACYTHQRDTRQNRWANRFVSFVRQAKQSRQDIASTI